MNTKIKTNCGIYFRDKILKDLEEDPHNSTSRNVSVDFTFFDDDNEDNECPFLISIITEDDDTIDVSFRPEQIEYFARNIIAKIERERLRTAKEN